MKVAKSLKVILLFCALVLHAVTSGAQPVTKIAAGGSYSLFLKSDGSLWAMGDNEMGELGDGTTDDGYYETNLPEQIVASNVTAIAGGWEDSLFLKSDGSLWGMGDNEYGELGDGTYGGYPYSLGTNRPEQIVASNVTAIAIELDFSLFLKSDGSMWAMGDNGYGQFGDGTNGTTTDLPEQIVASGATAIAAGSCDSYFLKSDGSLWGMGDESSGELGDGISSYTSQCFTNKPEQIVAGPPGYNQISFQLLSCGDMCLSYAGIANANYALDRSFNLSPANWTPQATNTSGTNGVLLFTNTPLATTNNFWRIRSVP